MMLLQNNALGMYMELADAKILDFQKRIIMLDYHKWGQIYKINVIQLCSHVLRN